MLDSLPILVPVGFGLCVVYTAAVLHYTPPRGWPWWVTGGVGLWLVVQSVLGWSGFYRPADPSPRPLLLLFPPTVVIVVALILPRSRHWLRRLPLRPLVWVHAMRVVVELVLWGLLQRAVIPRAMTFEGTNFDILTGLTVPLAAVFGFANGRPRRWVLIPWHLMGLGLLVNVVTTAVLSMPTPLQQLNIDQPCVGVLYFPFTWLPAFVVPAVLLAHLVSLARLVTPDGGPFGRDGCGRPAAARQVNSASRSSGTRRSSSACPPA